MNWRERLEVIAADYYTKFTAVRTTIDILSDIDKVEKIEKKPKKVKVSRKRNYNGKHWTQTEAGKKKLARAIRKAWKKRANKDNERTGKES